MVTTGMAAMWTAQAELLRARQAIWFRSTGFGPRIGWPTACVKQCEFYKFKHANSHLTLSYVSTVTWIEPYAHCHVFGCLLKLVWVYSFRCYPRIGSSINDKTTANKETTYYNCRLHVVQTCFGCSCCQQEKVGLGLNSRWPVEASPAGKNFN